MTGRRRTRKPECAHDDCGSSNFHVGDDGFTYCEQGHRQSELGTVIAKDTGELVVPGRKSRRRVESDAESSASKGSTYSGSKAFEHYLLCLQLVLRKQVQWIIEAQKVPREHETLMRDLWSLRLTKVQTKVSYDSETDSEARSSQMYSSQSEGGGRSDAETTSSRLSQQARRLRSKGPNLIELLCLQLIGMQLRRIPITLGDIHRWVNNGELLYYRAAKELPLSMKERLSGDYQQQFEPQILLAPETFHGRMLDLVSFFRGGAGMIMPPLNCALILYRWIRELTLPLEAFIATRRISRMLQDDLSYVSTGTSRETFLMGSPEVRLMAMLVVTVKLLFPFEDQEQNPESADDLGALHLDWGVWAAAQEPGQDETSKTDSLSFQDAFNMSESKSLQLAGQQLDEYLDWYESSIATDEIRERGKAGRDAEFQRTLIGMFSVDKQKDPKQSVDHESAQRNRDATVTTTTAKLITGQAAARPKPVVRMLPDVPRVGSSYPRYPTVDSLEGIAKTFHEQAASLASLSLDKLVMAIIIVERKVTELDKHLSEQSPRQK